MTERSVVASREPGAIAMVTLEGGGRPSHPSLPLACVRAVRAIEEARVRERGDRAPASEIQIPRGEWVGYISESVRVFLRIGQLGVQLV